VSGRDIDNPLRVFERIATETGAESFFPASERELQRVIGHILGILQAQYTLAYYSPDPGTRRRIQVKVNRAGLTVMSRRSAGAEGIDGKAVHFSSTSCEVSPSEHPYPWEPHVAQSPAQAMLYQDDFSDSRSGWPNRPGSRYVPGAYELSKMATSPKPSNSGGARVPIGRSADSEESDGEAAQSGRGEDTLAAYGPWWQNFRASLSVESSGAAARGMVFRLNAAGCYVLLLSGTRKGKDVWFKLVKKTFANHGEATLIPWTQITGPAPTLTDAGTGNRITVECNRDRITILLNGVQVTAIGDASFQDGYVGMAQYGYGRTLFRNLRVETLPDPPAAR
jgi:hypothetical protein